MKNKIIKAKAYGALFREKGKGKQWRETNNYPILYCKNKDHALELLSLLNDRELLEIETENEIFNGENLELAVVFLGMVRIVVEKESAPDKNQGVFYFHCSKLYEHKEVFSNKYSALKSRVQKDLKFIIEELDFAYIGNNVLSAEGHFSDFDDQINYLIETYKINCEVLNE